VNFRPARDPGRHRDVHQDPWTPRLADQLAIVTLVLPLRGLLAQKAGTWLEDLFWVRARFSSRASGIWARRCSGCSRCTTSAATGLSIWRATTRWSSPNFGDSDHLKIEEIAPASAVRRESRARGRRGRALTSPASQDVAAQSLRVQYHYFTGRINWRPIVIGALILLVTNWAASSC
jgi:hypothetical protein